MPAWLVAILSAIPSLLTSIAGLAKRKPTVPLVKPTAPGWSDLDAEEDAAMAKSTPPPAPSKP